MALDDCVLAFSPEVKIKLATVSIGDAEGTSLILPAVIHYFMGQENIGVRSFVQRLKAGDQVLVVEYGGKVVAMSGPVNEENLYFAK